MIDCLDKNPKEVVDEILTLTYPIIEKNIKNVNVRE